LTREPFPVRAYSVLEIMFITPAYAQVAGGPAAQGGGLAFVIGLAPYFAIFAVFYFLMIRPQQRRVKAMQAAVDAVKKGDSVVTGGGILGKITKVEERFVEVEIAPTTRIRVVKSTIAEVIDPTTAAAND
jgi:preprotein translocase subunit YajC